MFGWLGSLKGKFITASCRYLDLLPSQDLQDDLAQSGWRFRTIHGLAGENVVHQIVHPDGKPLYGQGAPGFISGEDGVIILPEHRKAYERRWADLSRAFANTPA